MPDLDLKSGNAGLTIAEPVSDFKRRFNYCRACIRLLCILKAAGGGSGGRWSFRGSSQGELGSSGEVPEEKVE